MGMELIKCFVPKADQGRGVWKLGGTHPLQINEENTLLRKRNCLQVKARTLSIRPKISVWISGNFQWRMRRTAFSGHFDILGKEDNSWGIPKFWKPFSPEISVPFASFPGISGIFSLMEFEFLKFNSFLIFWKLSHKRKWPYLSTPLRNFRNFRSNGKRSSCLSCSSASCYYILPNKPF